MSSDKTYIFLEDFHSADTKILCIVIGATASQILLILNSLFDFVFFLALLCLISISVNHANVHSCHNKSHYLTTAYLMKKFE